MSFEPLLPLSPRAARQGIEALRQKNQKIEQQMAQLQAQFRLQNTALDNLLDALDAAFTAAPPEALRQPDWSSTFKDGECNE